ncbi:MAG: aromatic amino acid lyase [Methanosarcinales archaeon]
MARGYSGIRLETLELLVQMLNKKVHPCIPEKGSVGASGDLAPLAHLALVIIGFGEAEYKGQILKGRDALEKAGLTPVTLEAKESLLHKKAGVGTQEAYKTVRSKIPHLEEDRILL